MRRILSAAACLLALAAVPKPVAAQLVLDVNQANFRRYPIAVTVPADLSGAGDAAGVGALGAEALSNDLDLSGLFRVLDPASFLEKPGAGTFVESQIDFTRWLQVGAEGLIKGGFAVAGDEVRLTLRLFDVALARMVLDRSYTLPVGQARTAYHRFADEVVRFFTKGDSIFLTRIVAVRKLEGRKQIYVCDFDGHNGRELTGNASINLLPSWSRDGRSIFFTTYLNGNPDLFRIDAATGRATPFAAFRGLNMGAAESPDGRRVAATLSRDGNSEIYLLDRDGANPLRLTNNWAIDSQASWSPDGSRIAFISNRSGNPHIYLMDAAGNDTRRLTFAGKYNQTPDWSPKGDEIVFTARDERLVFDLFKVRVESGEIVRLTQDQGNNEEPSWSPTGSHIVFASDRTGESKLWVMQADGSGQRMISRDKGEFFTPAWSPLPPLGGEPVPPDPVPAPAPAPPNPAPAEVTP